MDAPTVVEAHKWLGISLESWLTIAAVVIGPILALGAQRCLDTLRDSHGRKVRIFRELMITRSTRLSPRHVEALNAVPLEFESRHTEKKVLAAWKAYLAHLGTDSTKDPAEWQKTGSGLLIELLYEMSQRLGYKFEKLNIQNEIYLPQLFNILEQEQTMLRRQLLALTDGTGRLKLPIASFEQSFPDVRPPGKK